MPRATDTDTPRLERQGELRSSRPARQKLGTASRLPASEALRRHWPEYLMEAAELAAFMVAALLATALIDYPRSPLHLGQPLLQRLLIGLAMGTTAVAIIYSPWGRQSGAHFNPAVTIAFFRLGKVRPWDAFFYVSAQFAGGLAGVLAPTLILGRHVVASRAVNYVVTIPGSSGTAIAFLAEFGMAFGLMTTVLLTTNNRRLERFTGVFAGTLVALYITIEAPLSGMSINPARTVGSAIPAGAFDSLWIYVTAPPIGMLAAAEAFRRLRQHPPRSGKLVHDPRKPCIFRCTHHLPTK